MTLNETLHDLQVRKSLAIANGDYSDSRFDILTSDTERKEIMNKTAAFIGRIVAERPDVLLYLDKSARPLCWLVDAVLKKANPGIKPRSANINVGQEKIGDFDWIRKRRYKPQHWDMIDQLRKAYQDPAGGDSTIFTGNRVWIVDDFSVTGGSLRMAERLVARMTERDGSAAKVATHVLLDDRPTPPIWHNTTGVLGIVDSPDNPFTTIAAPGSLTDQFVREIGYMADQMRVIHSS